MRYAEQHSTGKLGETPKMLIGDVEGPSSFPSHGAIVAGPSQESLDLAVASERPEVTVQLKRHLDKQTGREAV